MAIQGVKGMQDILPPEGRVWRAVEQAAAEIFEAFGYDEIRTPILEHTDLFARSIGGETDIVSKEMYTFEDKGGRSVTMRPEGTAAVVRSFLDHKLYGRQNVHRLFYMGPMFRYERMQKGRLRQFHQIGGELYGLASPLADAEIVALQHAFFKRLGVPGLALEINNLGSVESRGRYAAALQAHLRAHADVLCADCVRRTDTNPLRALDCKVPACQPVLGGAPSIIDFADAESERHFATFRERLDALGIAHEVNAQMVRGLDYYTGVVFEFTSTGLGAKNTLSAGGRYDNLVTELGGPATPAVGFACGVERLLLLLGEMVHDIPPRGTRLFLAVLSPAAEKVAARLSGALREAGIRVEEDLGRAGLKSQMKAANRVGADWVVLLGEDEVARGEAGLKNMTTGEQVAVGLEAEAMLARIRS